MTTLAPALTGIATPPPVETPLTRAIPMLFEAYEIANLISWPRRRCLRLLKELKIVQKRGGRWIVARNALRQKLPEVYEGLVILWNGGDPAQGSGRPQGVTPAEDDHEGDHEAEDD